MAQETRKGSAVSNNLMYRKAPEMIEWLCKVFGFRKHAIYPGPDNTIQHSELTFGGGMIMIGSMNDGPFRKYTKHPDELAGAGTTSMNLVVEDADALYARAKAAGAKILFDIEDKHYGGRGFTCADPEGYIWNVGTYDPWADK